MDLMDLRKYTDLYIFSSSKVTYVRGDGCDQPPSPTFLINILLKTQWESINKFMTKKHTLVAVAAIIAAKRSALEKRYFINLATQSRSNLTFGQDLSKIHMK